MRQLFLISFIAFSFVLVMPSYAQENTEANAKVKKDVPLAKMKSKALIVKVFELFENGKYESAVEALDILQKRINTASKKSQKVQGLIYYWKAMSYARMSDFEEAEKYFIQALELKYFTDNIYYEYGQVLYVANKYKRARIAFKKSVKANYKKAVSLYYIAFISQELKDYKKAVTFYNMIESTDADDRKDVIQAARMQVGDIYLKQIERQRDPFKGVEKYVIPQYKKALNWDEDSRLAEDIRLKIRDLQRKYELVLFRMRNGRPTAQPPYYVRANLLYGQNDNVTRTDETTKASLEKKDYSSPYYQAGFFGRYSFYPNSAFSYAPELDINYTKYTSDSTSILPFNTYYVKAALKMNYEHTYKNQPATTYIDFDYKYTADDADADEKFAESLKTYGVQISEQIPLWTGNPTTFRLRYEKNTAVEETASFNSLAFNLEQIMFVGRTTLYWFNSYTVSNYAEAETSNSNVLTSRMDFIFPTFFNLFNPTLYASMTSSNYVNDSDKGTPSLTTYGINLNRPLGKHYYLTLDYSMASQTADLDADNYKQNVITLNLDYIY